MLLPLCICQCLCASKCCRGQGPPPRRSTVPGTAPWLRSARPALRCCILTRGARGGRDRALPAPAGRRGRGRPARAGSSGSRAPAAASPAGDPPAPDCTYSRCVHATDCPACSSCHFRGLVSIMQLIMQLGSTKEDDKPQALCCSQCSQCVAANCSKL